MDDRENAAIEVVDMLGTRLDALFTLAENRKHGLECDLKMNSMHCSQKVISLKETTGDGMIQHVDGPRVSSAVSAGISTNSRLYEQFASLEENQRFNMSGSMGFNKESRKTETKRNLRNTLEKQLMSVMSKHISRSVDSAVFVDIVQLPISIDTKLVIGYACARMNLLQGKRTILRIAMTEASCSQFTTLFWFIFCNCFQKHSDDIQRNLVHRVSSLSVDLLSSLRGNKDYFYKVYPYAISSAICWAFHYYFPGSRHMYTKAFKSKVFTMICEMLLGMKLCPTSILATRKLYFPDESYETISARAQLEINASPMLTSSASSLDLRGSMQMSTMKGAMLNPHSLDTTSNTLRQLQSSQSESSFGYSGSSIRPIDRIMETVAKASHGMKLQQPRSRQVRKKFNATQLSPLVQQYLQIPNESLNRAFYLRRTTPTPFCPVGGQDTYLKSSNIQSKYDIKELAKSKSNNERDRRSSQQALEKEIRRINSLRDDIINSRGSKLNRFCLDLVQSQKE